VVDNIKMKLREIGWDGIVWIDLAQDRDQCKALVNTVMNIRVPKNAGKFFRERENIFEKSETLILCSVHLV
jgi:hypothetical protein